MHILYISSKKRWGGVASWMVRTARELVKRGHTVWILSHPESKINEEFPDDLNLISYKLGFEYNPLSIAFLIKVIKQKKIQLIVTNLEKEVGIGGIAAWIAGVPNIRRVGREDDFNDSIKNRWNHQTLVFASIVPCDAIKNGAKSRASWLDTTHFKTIYNGRNAVNYSTTDILALRKQWGIKEHQQIIGITVQLLKVKQVDILINSFAALHNKYKNIKLVICGIGKEEQNLKNLVSDLGIEKEVVFAGYIKQPMLAAAAYDIAVLNSRLEGFPNTIVEYFAAGKPVISTNVGGVSEIIQDGENGFLVDPGDQNSLIDKLEMLITDKELRIKFSMNSIQTLKEKFTEVKMIDEVEDFFYNQIEEYAKLH